MKRLWCLLLAIALPALAQAQSYPSQPVRVVVPGAPGNALDVLARLMMDVMGKSMNASFIVDNKPGASGHIGAESVARAKADGYTLSFSASTTHAVSPHVMKINYDPVGDFAPVTLVAKVHNVLVVHPDVPVKDMKELVAYAKANPGKLSFGSTGVGSNLHLGVELLKLQTGIDMQHVPYSSGALHTDLLSNRIQLLLDNMPVALPHIKVGKLRPIGVASLERQPELPDVPPIADTIPGYFVGAWGALLAPKGTPPEVVGKLNAAAVAALKDPAVVEGFLKQSFHPAPMSPAETGAFMRSEHAKWGKVVKDANIQAN